MEIATIPISQIRPAAWNPRKDLKPGDPRYQALRASIEEYGYLEPIIWNRRTGNLVGGHQRLKVLQEQGATEAQVSIVDLDAVREKALAIALNKISGEWEEDLLAAILQDLQDQAPGATTGFLEQETQDLLLRLQAAGDLARFEELMGPGVDREAAREQAEQSRAAGEIVTITLRAGREVLTRDRIKAIRAEYAPLGVEINIKEPGS